MTRTFTAKDMCEEADEKTRDSLVMLIRGQAETGLHSCVIYDHYESDLRFQDRHIKWLEKRGFEAKIESNLNEGSPKSRRLTISWLQN